LQIEAFCKAQFEENVWKGEGGGARLVLYNIFSDGEEGPESCVDSGPIPSFAEYD
jgi:hypothetical protein